jgi:hypothetical protein
MRTLRDDSPHTLRSKAKEFRRLAAMSVVELHDLADSCEQRAIAIEKQTKMSVKKLDTQ